VGETKGRVSRYKGGGGGKPGGGRMSGGAKVDEGGGHSIGRSHDRLRNRVTPQI
jgi:hypothetical protein